MTASASKGKKAAAHGSKNKKSLHLNPAPIARPTRGEPITPASASAALASLSPDIEWSGLDASLPPSILAARIARRQFWSSPSPMEQEEAEVVCEKARRMFWDEVNEEVTLLA